MGLFALLVLVCPTSALLLGANLIIGCLDFTLPSASNLGNGVLVCPASILTSWASMAVNELGDSPHTNFAADPGMCLDISVGLDFDLLIYILGP